MPSEKHLQGVDHRNLPKPYPAPAAKPFEHPAFGGAQSAALHKPIHHLDPKKPYGSDLPPADPKPIK